MVTSLGQITKRPTSCSVRAMPSEVKIDRLENDFRQRFDGHILKLVNLYGLAEKVFRLLHNLKHWTDIPKYQMKDLMNCTIDTIQVGFWEYGSCFRPRLNALIFLKTKKDSKLRDLRVSANIIQIDRGCIKIRQEIMDASIINPAYFSHMLKWISRNFAMFGRREREGCNGCRPKEGFSVFNRSKLCPCHIHVHDDNSQVHKNHAACAISFLDCSHGEEDDEEDTEFGNNDSGVGFAAFLRTLVWVSR